MNCNNNLIAVICPYIAIVIYCMIAFRIPILSVVDINFCIKGDDIVLIFLFLIRKTHKKGRKVVF